MKKIFLTTFILIILLTSNNNVNAANAVTFKNFDELNACVDFYNSFLQYKKNFQECLKQQDVIIEKNSLKLIKNDYGIIEDIIELNLPKEETIKKPKKKLSEILKNIFQPDLEKIEEEENIFNQTSAFSDEYREKQFSLNDQNFRDLNNHIKVNPEDIYAITEDINILTYKNKYLSEFKRQEILLNIYNAFDVTVLASKVPPSSEVASFGPAAAGIVAVAALAGGGSGGGTYSPPTISFSVSSTSVGECDSDVTVTANLTKAHNANVTVTYAVGGTATQDTDYTLSSTTSTIVSGATSGTITLNPTNDTTDETSETVTLSASVSEVSTTGNTSTTITIHDYVLKCNTTAFSVLDTSRQSTIVGLTAWNNIDMDNDIHPYEQMNIHKAQASKSGSTFLTGAGQKIHIADFHCDEDHDIFGGRVTLNLDNGGAGESTFDTPTSTWNEHHCQTVATFAGGDPDTGTHMGVAPGASFILSSIPNFQGSNEGDDYAADLDAARAAGAVVSNNSWGWTVGGSSYSISEFEADRVTLGLTGAEGIARLMHGTSSGQDLTDANTYITALDNFQQSGVVVFSAGNSPLEADAGIIAGLPEYFSQLKEAWIVVNVTDFVGSSLSGATESEFTLKGNKCGSTAAYCLTGDGFNVGGGEWINSGTSVYSSSAEWGSSYSAPMVSGGVALLAQAFPNHTPEQLAQRIFASAKNDWFTPTGATTFTTHGASIKHGYHSTWGHGLPDFYAALSPITSSSNSGSFGFPSGGGGGGGGSGGGGSVPFSQIEKLAVSSTGMKTSSSFGDGIMNGLKNRTAYAYDALNGGFELNVNDFINYEQLNEQRIEYSVNEELNSLRSFNVNKNQIRSAKNFDVYAGEYFNFRDKYNKGLSVTLDQPNIALQNFNLYNNQHYKNPFTSENKGVGFNNKFYFFGNNVLLGYNNSKFNPITSINKNSVLPMETLALSMNIDSSKFDLLSFTTGLLKEENTFLLSEGSGAFNLTNKNNLSNFYGFNFSKNLNNFGNIYFSSMFGNSKLDNAQNSLIVDTSNVLSSSFEVNYELKNLFDNDQLNISFSQPNRVEDGEMTFRFMGLADKNGILPYQDHKVSLTPSGRQKDLTVSYYKNHLRNLKTGIKAVLTDDLGHIKDNNLDANLLLTATYNF